MWDICYATSKGSQPIDQELLLSVLTIWCILSQGSVLKASTSICRTSAQWWNHHVCKRATEVGMCEKNRWGLWLCGMVQPSSRSKASSWPQGGPVGSLCFPWSCIFLEETFSGQRELWRKCWHLCILFS